MNFRIFKQSTLLILLCYLFVFDFAFGSDSIKASDSGDSGGVSGPDSSGGDGDRTDHDFGDDYGGSSGGSGGRDDRDSRDDRDDYSPLDNWVDYDNHGPLEPGGYRHQPTRPKLSDDPKKDTLDERLYRHWLAKNESNFRARRRRVDLTAQEVTYFTGQFDEEMKKAADEARKIADWIKKKTIERGKKY